MLMPELKITQQRKYNIRFLLGGGSTLGRVCCVRYMSVFVFVSLLLLSVVSVLVLVLMKKL
jgi:dolichyl-phosphate-mannose--protein O-mannosyl transferase